MSTLPGTAMPVSPLPGTAMRVLTLPGKLLSPCTELCQHIILARLQRFGDARSRVKARRSQQVVQVPLVVALQPSMSVGLFSN